MALTPSYSFDLRPEDYRRLQGNTVAAPAGAQVGAQAAAVPAPTRGAATSPPPPPAPGAVTAPLQQAQQNVAVGAGVPAPAVSQNRVDGPVAAVATPTPAQNQTATQGLAIAPAAPPAPVQTPVAPPAPVEAPTPAPVQQPAVAATQPLAPPVEAAVQAPVKTVEPQAVVTPTNPMTPASLPPDDPYKGAMDDFYAMAKNWMTGTSDPAIRTAMNRALDQIGLHNQAAMDALKMQINQDPTLRGQGAGLALLNSMARDQNFKVDDIIANMSEKNLERIVNMQKYGFEAAIQLEAKQYGRREDTANNLIAAGDYAGAAKLLQQNAENVAPGMGLNITAESLRNRDPFEIKRTSDALGLVKDLAKTDPAAATALLNAMIASNPTLKSWLPDGITAEQMISSFTSGESAANAQAATALRGSINTDIANGGDYATVSGRLIDLFKLQNRDATKEGSALSLERINEIRKEDGLPPLTDKADLDNVDYEELGYRNEFYKTQAKANEEPWQATYDAIMKTSDASKFLDSSLFVGGADALKDFLIYQSLGIVDYDFDPATGTLVPSTASDKLPWENPDLYSMFYHMPMASFDKDGKVVGEFTNGGSAYSETAPKSDNDTALQPKYAAYLTEREAANAAPLSAPQWYFATAGGTKPVNMANIPSSVTSGTSSDPDAPINASTVFDPIEFKTAFNLLTPTAAAEKLKDPTYLQNAIDSGAIPVINNAAALATTNWADLAKTGLGYAAINGKLVTIGTTGSYKPPDAGGKGLQYVRFTSADGKSWWLVTKSDASKYPVGMVTDGDPTTAPTNDWSRNIGNYNG